MTLIFNRVRGAFLLDGKPCAVKMTRACRLAVRRNGQWHYFRWSGQSTTPTRYEQTGSSLRLDHR